MADRSIKVTLRADAAQAIAEAKKLAGSFTDLSKASEVSVGRAGKAWEVGGQQQAAAAKKAQAEQEKAAKASADAQEKAAQKTKDAWQTTGTALTVVGGAWTALNVAIAKTGIEYNTLQQTSRAAMGTLLGDAEAVNAQMDELDAFAKTSPFSKATFITAQQQMLAFGIEAEKVVPYLDAINDATAAAGGNNQTLSELAFIMAQISAAGKITAQDLMQFGQRGVNAAELIGSQMGKTGAQIREDISDGALGADEALDALAAGMKETFDGASANVKETMGGALDRVSAAFRDLSADVMGSAVSPDGGGWLVDLTNSAADFLRMIGSLPDGVKQVGGIVSGVGGAATLAAGGFILLAPKVLETFDALRELGVKVPEVRGKLGGLGKAAAGTAGVIAGLAVIGLIRDEMNGALPALEKVQETLAAMADGKSVNLDRMFRSDGSGFSSIDGFHDAMNELYGDMDRWELATSNLEAMWSDLTGSMSKSDRAREAIGQIDRALKDMEPEQAATALNQLAESMGGLSDVALVSRFPEYADSVRSQLQGLTDELGPMAASMGNVADVMRGDLPDGLVWTAEGLMTAKGAAEQGVPVFTDLAAAEEAAAEATKAHQELLDKTSDALSKAVEMSQQYSNSLLALSGSKIASEKSIASLNKTIEENTKEYGKNAGGLDLTTEAGWKNQEALDAVVAASQRQIETLHTQGATNDEITAATKRSRDAWIEGAKAMGMSADEAEDLAEAYFAIPSEVSTWMTTQGLDVAQEDLGRWEAALDELSEEEKTAFFAELDGKSQAYVEGRLDYLARDRTTNVHVTQTGGVVITPTIRGGGRGISIPEANGGVLDFYASGGFHENHTAQIAPAGAWRVWAEPETGGESYIPLAPSKRARSLDIWQETGRRLGVQGFANGGLHLPTYQPGGSSTTTYGEQTHTYHLSFPGMTEVADVIRVIKDAPRQARLNGGRR